MLFKMLQREYLQPMSTCLLERLDTYLQTREFVLSRYGEAIIPCLNHLLHPSDQGMTGGVVVFKHLSNPTWGVYVRYLASFLLVLALSILSWRINMAGNMELCP